MIEIIKGDNTETIMWIEEIIIIIIGDLIMIEDLIEEDMIMILEIGDSIMIIQIEVIIIEKTILIGEITIEVQGDFKITMVLEEEMMMVLEEEMMIEDKMIDFQTDKMTISEGEDKIIDLMTETIIQEEAKMID